MTGTDSHTITSHQNLVCRLHYQDTLHLLHLGSVVIMSHLASVLHVLDVDVAHNDGSDVQILHAPPSTSWRVSSTQAVLDAYEELYIELKRGKSWRRVADAITRSCTWKVTHVQGKQKMEALKTHYKQEQLKRGNTRGSSVNWEW